MKQLKIGCQKHKIDSLLLSSRCMTNYMKSCSFLHAHFFELMKVVENLFKKKLMVKNSFIEKIIEKTYVVGTHWNCLIEAIPICTFNIMLLKIRQKTIWKITSSKFHVHCIYFF